MNTIAPARLALANVALILAAGVLAVPVMQAANTHHAARVEPQVAATGEVAHDASARIRLCLATTECTRPDDPVILTAVRRLHPGYTIKTKVYSNDDETGWRWAVSAKGPAGTCTYYSVRPATQTPSCS